MVIVQEFGLEKKETDLCVVDNTVNNVNHSYQGVTHVILLTRERFCLFL